MAFKIAGLFLLFLIGADATRTKDRVREVQEVMRGMVKAQMKNIDPEHGMSEQQLDDQITKDLSPEVYNDPSLINMDEDTFKLTMDALRHVQDQKVDPASFLEQNDESEEELIEGLPVPNGNIDTERLDLKAPPEEPEYLSQEQINDRIQRKRARAHQTGETEEEEEVADLAPVVREYTTPEGTYRVETPHRKGEK